MYTPTTNEVRDWYAHKGGPPYYTSKLEKRMREFDRWLTQHDTEVRAQALRDAADAAEEWRAAEGMHGGEWFPSEWAGQVAGWIEHRADRIEKEES